MKHQTVKHQGKSALGIVRKYHPNVTRIVDSRKALVMDVTQADCRRAVVKAPDQCAMAKACQHEHDGAIISMSVAYVIDGDTATRYKVPASVSREITSFDRQGGFAPGQYRLSPVPKSESLARFRGPNKTERPHHKSKGIKKHYHKTAGIRSL